MLEQQLAERFHAVVADEPPLALDPDELVDRLLRRRHRRLGVATALGVVVVATVAAGGAAVGGAATVGTVTGDLRVAPPPPEASDTATTATTVTAVVAAGTHGVVGEQGEHTGVRSVSAFRVDAVPTDQGAVELRRGGQVLFHASLAEVDAHVFRPAEPVLLKPGQRVRVAVKCLRTLARTGACHVDVTFSARPVPR